MSYIAVIGAGSWGTTLAKLLGDKDYDTSLWVYEQDLAEEIKRTRVNSAYMPEVTLPDSVNVSSSLADVLENARYIISVIPVRHTRAVFKNALPHIPGEAIIMSASKGIEQGSNLTVSAILKEMTSKTISVLSGPSFAKEVACKLPTAVTLASEDYTAALLLQETFTTSYFRVYTHHDVLGVEIAGALKNVMAIAAGISDGLCLGYNSRAALITRGLAEMTRLGVVIGAKEYTFSGLSGLGDLVLTCTGPLSRNYTVGLNLGRGMKIKDIVSATRSIAEGVDTAKSAHDLARKHNIEMPIIEQVYSVIYEDKNPREAVHDLMNRTLKSEFYG
ncbi:MAG: NAD(P)H-dependent glycerol-3-phosphate dehydrogenase [Thermodesulfovibrionales bacterium]|nr:NAD(P)H-dependent glycerol-3-phosphate dehydrogenase [Thermodesulfovibrionales bacterium]